MERDILPRHTPPQHENVLIVAGLAAGMIPVGFIVAWQRSLRGTAPAGAARLKDYDQMENSDSSAEQKTCALP